MLEISTIPNENSALLKEDLDFSNHNGLNHNGHNGN